MPCRCGVSVTFTLPLARSAWRRQPAYGHLRFISRTVTFGQEVVREIRLTCADVVWIPMKVRATQIRLIWAGRAARDVDWILDPKDCYGHGGVGPQLARPA